MGIDMDRYAVSVHLVVEATTREMAQSMVSILLRDPPIRGVTYVHSPILLKDDSPQGVEVHRDIPSPPFIPASSWDRYSWDRYLGREAHEDVVEAIENAEYRASVEQYDEDSINSNEVDMGTTNRD